MLPSSGAGNAGAAPQPADPTSAIPSDAAANWTMFAHDQQRTGFQGVPTGITGANVSKLSRRWYWKDPGGYGFDASPVVANGTVYVVDNKGNLYALSAATSTSGKPKIKWSYALGGDTVMTPLISGGMVYVGTHVPYYISSAHPSEDSYGSTLFAFNAASGQLIWKQTIKAGFRSAPVIVDGKLYIGLAFGDTPYCNVGGVEVYDAVTGERGSEWVTDPGSPYAGSTGDGGAVWGPISYDGSRLLFGTGNTCQTPRDHANSIVAISPSRTTEWYIRTDTNSFDDNDVAGGMLISGTTGYVIGKTGDFYAVNTATGNKVWTKTLNSLSGFGLYATPTIATGPTLIVGSGFNTNPNNLPSGASPGGTLWGLTTSGSVRWKITTEWPSKGDGAATGDIVFEPLDNELAALDPLTGKKLWHYDAVGLFVASPALSSDGLFEADLDGYVYAFGMPTGSSAKSAASEEPPLPRTYFDMPTDRHPAIPVFCKT
jgi:outer membrane protein assembly factor BamB